jgi:sensor histidine kinase YesM
MTLEKIPVKNLVRLNWVSSLMSSILIFTFLLATKEDLHEAINRFFEALLFLTSTGFCNLLLLMAFTKSSEPSKKSISIKFFFCSYLSAIIIWAGTKMLYSVITGLSWKNQEFSDRWNLIPSILAVLALNTLILILQHLVVLQHRKVRDELENLQLKANASETANLLLRQQIHPHFLFNSLNTIKSLYNEDHKQGEAYLIHLANFLRISISNQTSTTVPVKNELEFCLDYLKMQKIRFDTALNYVVNIDDETVQTKFLPYFSLQPLVENVLKHNDLTEDWPIMITIEAIDGYLRVSNNQQPKKYKEPSTGQGLSNLSERYKLLGSDDIRINSDNSTFSVSVKLLSQ